jgi:hypothetical protein
LVNLEPPRTASDNFKDVYKWLNHTSSLPDTKWTTTRGDSYVGPWNYYNGDNQPKLLFECNADHLRISGIGDRILDEVYTYLTQCENVQSLDLEHYHGGCVGYDHTRTFVFKDGDKFPDLETLRLSGYL